jgi:hypothetical protein
MKRLHEAEIGSIRRGLPPSSERRINMEKGTFFAILLTVAIVLSLGSATTANAGQPDQSGPHYNLNIIGFANCKMEADGVYPDCFKGQDGPGGAWDSVPLKTTQENARQDGTSLTEPITNATAKGVRIRH